MGSANALPARRALLTRLIGWQARHSSADYSHEPILTVLGFASNLNSSSRLLSGWLSLLHRPDTCIHAPPTVFQRPGLVYTSQSLGMAYNALDASTVLHEGLRVGG